MLGSNTLQSQSFCFQIQTIFIELCFLRTLCEREVNPCSDSLVFSHSRHLDDCRLQQTLLRPHRLHLPEAYVIGKSQ